MKVVFPYLTQAHLLLHSLPIAAALAERHREVEVVVASPRQVLIELARRLVARHAPLAPLRFDRLALGPGDRLRLDLGLSRRHSESYALLRNRRYFAGFDAVVTPERGALFLRRVGVRTPLIWTHPGAGDGDAQDAAASGFDFVLLAGRKIERRLLDAGALRAGRYVTGIYAKFDWTAAAPRERLFQNERPTVLYNPHFCALRSSWPRLGRGVLDTLAASTRYNLVFAPHLRLFDAPRDADAAAFSAYAGLPHVRVDLGSERSIDMSYTRGADVYLGDVDSQVAEFVTRPRPCTFFNARRADWRGDPQYFAWTMGPVLRWADRLEAQLDRAIERQAYYVEAQRAYVDDSFGEHTGPSAARGADAIVDHLRRNHRP